jgi:crotonobetainyl-CoA:carnitine CoA-transferase CaiB-like acyl-CoA transferase
MTGMQWRFGGPASPLMEPLAVTDYGTGILVAFATALALYHRQRTGQGQAVEASLAHTGTYLQTPFLLLHAGKQWDEPSGQEARGSGPLQRFYQASDGWFFLGAKESQAPALLAELGLPELSEGSLEAAFAQDSIAAWSARLRPLDIGLQGCPSIEALMQDPWVRAQGLSITRHHEGVGRVTGIGPSIRMRPSPAVPGIPVRPPGADGRAVLAELGYAPDEIARLESAGVLAVPGT